MHPQIASTYSATAFVIESHYICVICPYINERSKRRNIIAFRNALYILVHAQIGSEGKTENNPSARIWERWSGAQKPFRLFCELTRCPENSHEISVSNRHPTEYPRQRLRRLISCDLSVKIVMLLQIEESALYPVLQILLRLYQRRNIRNPVRLAFRILSVGAFSPLRSISPWFRLRLYIAAICTKRTPSVRLMPVVAP